MQEHEKQAEQKKGRGIGTIVTALVLALVLGVGGYFGVTMLMTGRSPLDIIGIGRDTPTSDLPTDKDGNNLIGNSMQNLYAGSLITIQGQDIFYANPADNGTLYCRDRKGNITKLTDFAVANLNVSGERLIFTDLSACTIVGEDGGTVTLSADTQEELWEQADESDYIRYGGRLYFIMGVKSFCEGTLNYEELTIAGLESEERYQAPILMEGGGILLIAASPEGGITPTSANIDLASALVPMPLAGGSPVVQPTKAAPVAYTPDSVITLGADGAMRRVSLDTSKGDVIQNAVVAGDEAFVATVNIADSSRLGNTITRIDPATGEALATISGHSIQSDGKNMYFIDKDVLFKYDSKTGEITQVTRTPCDSTSYEIRSDGTVHYQTKDPYTDTLVSMRAIPQENGTYEPHMGNSSLGFELGKRNKFFLGGTYYAWNRNFDGWIRVEYEWLTEGPDGDTELHDRTETPMPWDIPQRDRGQNRVQWTLPGELGGLFSSGNKPKDTSGASGTASTSSSSSSSSTSSSSTSSSTSSSSSSSTSSSTSSSSSSSSSSSVSSSGSSSSLEGMWQRTEIPGEKIYFTGNRITWTLGGLDGKIILAGTFEVRGGQLYIDAGAQGSTSFDFSQSGNQIQIGNWTYEKQ